VGKWWILGLGVILGACGGGHRAPASIGPQATAEDAVRAFMQAVADSNIQRMSNLWGTTKGPASKTGQPSDYEKRLQVTQVYLRGSPYKVLASEPFEGDPARRKVVIELDRTQCVKAVPFVLVRVGDTGWIVNSVDLNAAGSPTRACETLPPPDSKPRN
jgi:hypothetical protein